MIFFKSKSRSKIVVLVASKFKAVQQNDNESDKPSADRQRVSQRSPSPNSSDFLQYEQAKVPSVQPAINQEQKTDTVSVRALVSSNGSSIFSEGVGTSETSVEIIALNSMPTPPSDEAFEFPNVPTDAPDDDNSKQIVMIPGG